MEDHFLELTKAAAKFFEARRNGQFDKASALRVLGHGSLWGADRIDDQPAVIGQFDAAQQDAEDDLLELMKEFGGRAPKISIGVTRAGRNGELIRAFLPFFVKYILPLIIADGAERAMASVIGDIFEN